MAMSTDRRATDAPRRQAAFGLEEDDSDEPNPEILEQVNRLSQ